MAKYVPKAYEQVLQRMINRVVARSKLSDLTDTSQAKTLLAACAREIDDLYFQTNNLLNLFSIDRAAGEDLDERAADYNPQVVTRRTAARATGTLTFSRATPAPNDIPIPLGSRVEVPGENPALAAVTTAAGVIPMGNLSSAGVSARMEEPGARGNVAAGTLTKFKGARPPGVDSVTNVAGFVGGADAETDDSFRERIKSYVRTLSRCTPEALEFIASSVELSSGQRVVFAKVVEDPIRLGRVYLYVDDGAGTAEQTATNAGTPEILTSGPEFPGDVAQGGEQYLYTNHFPIKDSATFNLTKNGALLTRDDPGANGFTLNPASGQVYLRTPLVAGDSVALEEYTWLEGLMAEVQKVVDGDPSNRVDYPGWRAAGVLVVVRAPTIVNVVIEGNLTVRDGYNQADVRAKAETVAAAYVNGLGIGADVIRAEIIERVMAVEGMHDFTLMQPAANIVILDDQLPRTNTATDIDLN